MADSQAAWLPAVTLHCRTRRVLQRRDSHRKRWPSAWAPSLVRRRWRAPRTSELGARTGRSRALTDGGGSGTATATATTSSDSDRVDVQFGSLANALFAPLRLLRLLRLLKVLRSVPQLQLIVVAFLEGLASVRYIGVLLCLAIYIYAIFGVMAFKLNGECMYVCENARKNVRENASAYVAPCHK